MSSSNAIGICRSTLATLVEVLECLSGEPCDLSGDDAASAVAALARGEHACTALRLLCARRVASTAHHETEGYRDAAEWLGAMTGDSYYVARQELESSAALDKAPATLAAFVSGDLSSAQAREIAKTVKADPSSEESLLALAGRSSLTELKTEAAKVRAAARSSESDRQRHARLRSRRRLSSWTGDEGEVMGRFSLTPEDGAIVLGRLGKIADRLFEENRATETKDSRSTLMADALVALAGGEPVAFPDSERGGSSDPSEPDPSNARSGSESWSSATHAGAAPEGAGAPADPRAGGAAPEGAGAAADPRADGAAPEGAGAPADPRAGGAAPGESDCDGVGDDHGAESQDAAEEGPPTKVSRLRPDYSVVMRIDLEALVRGSLLPGEEASIDGVGPVPISLVQSFLDRAKIRLVVESGVEIRSVFSFRRTIPVALRTALEHRDRTCVVPGCTSTFHLEIDHILEVERGGPTCLANTCRLCRHHHDMKTNDGWRVEGGPGTWRFVLPESSNRVGQAARPPSRRQVAR